MAEAALVVSGDTSYDVGRDGKVTITPAGRLRVDALLVGSGGGSSGVDALVPVTTATLTNVASSASSQTISALNTSRRAWSVFNDDENAVKIKFGATASSTSYTVSVQPFQFYEMPLPIYTGRIDGIWDADGTGSLRVTELS